MAGKRSIFQEVGEGQAVPVAPTGGGIDARPKGARRGIRLWLIALFLWSPR
jgi:heme a synthase